MVCCFELSEEEWCVEKNHNTWIELRVWQRSVHHWQDYCCWSLYSRDLSNLTLVFKDSSNKSLYTVQIQSAAPALICSKFHELWVCGIVPDWVGVSHSSASGQLHLILTGCFSGTLRASHYFSAHYAKELSDLHKHTHTHIKEVFCMTECYHFMKSGFNSTNSSVLLQHAFSACAQTKYSLNASVAMWHWTEIEAKSQQLIFTKISGL